MQTIIVSLIVLAAAAYAGRGAWRALAATRRPKPGSCGAECGCGQSRASQ